MSQRLPKPGGDNGDWGDILNAFLEVSHNGDGSLANNTVGTNQLQSGSVTNTQLDSTTQSILSTALTQTTADSTYVQQSSLGASGGVATLTGTTLSSTQIPSSVVRGSSQPIAEGQVAMSVGSSSNAIEWQTKTVIDIRDGYGALTNGVSDDSATFQAALSAAVAADAILDIGNLTILLTTEVLIDTPSVHWVRIRGEAATILDGNTSGPCLRYHETSTNGRVMLDGFTVELSCQKETYNMVELVNLSTAGMWINVDFTTSSIGAYYKCHSALYIANSWEGNIRGQYRSILGHGIYYTCPNLNGGNLNIDTQSIDVQNGHYVDGADTNNNILFNNSKWVSNYEAYEFCDLLTTSLPAEGATSITLPTSLSQSYFPSNCAVVLFSPAGMEVVYGTSYNASTGVLSLVSGTTLTHTATLYVITCSNWSVITNYLCPNLQFENCHFEESPAFIKDAPNLLVNDAMWSCSQTSYTGTPVGFYIAGGSAVQQRFNNTYCIDPLATSTTHILVRAVVPSTASGWFPSIHVDGMHTYNGTPSQPSGGMTSPAAWQALLADSGYVTEHIDLGLAGGVQLTTTAKADGWSIVTTFTSSSGVSSYTVLPNIETLLVNASAYAATIIPLHTTNKKITVKKTDSSANAVTINGEGHNIDGASTYVLTSQYQSATIVFDGTNYQILSTSAA